MTAEINKLTHLTYDLWSHYRGKWNEVFSINVNQAIYLLKTGKITRATEQNEQDSQDNDVTDSCWPRNVRIWTILYYTSLGL